MQTSCTSTKSVITWTQYLNTKLDLKTWKSRFSSSKSWKTRETIILVFSLTGIGAYISQTQFASSKHIRIRETILLAIDLTGIGAYISQNLNTSLTDVSFQVPKK